MFVLRYGRAPSKVVSLVAMMCVAAPSILLVGCASDKTPSYVQGPSPQQMAAARKVEMEDDGQPVQAPPARAVRPEEDDPTQPWSPHYGGNGLAIPKTTAGAPAQAVRSPNPYVPTQVDALAVAAPRPIVQRASETTTGFRTAQSGSSTRLTDADADIIMAQAINAQEMRRR